MATVADSTQIRKPTAFHGTFHDVAGVITLHQGRALFLEPESGAVVTITPADEAALVVLGEVETAMAACLDDMARGGAARIACDRLQEVA